MPYWLNKTSTKNKIKMNKFNILLILALITSVFCYSQKATTIIHKAEVLEVVQVKSYTYLRIAENGKEKWLAAPTITAEVGETYFYKGGMEMPSFKSSELDRTFNVVLFLQTISKNKADLEVTNKQDISLLKKKKLKSSNEKLEINIEPIEMGVSIEELLKNRDLYKDKLVKVRGQVTKYSSQIMSKNWVHLQDGTDFKGKFDLTITTNAVVSVGEVVIFEGKVSLDKNYGGGYFYKLIIENAVLIE